MPSTLGAPHGAGSNHANAGPPDIPTEPLRRRTPEEHRALMEQKSAQRRRFADGSKAAASATYEASIEPRADEPPPVADGLDVDVEPTPSPPAPARPVSAPPRSPVNVSSTQDPRTLAMATAYVSGDSLLTIATNFHVGQATVRSVLAAAGVQLRKQGQRANPRNAAERESTPATVAPDGVPQTEHARQPAPDLHSAPVIASPLAPTLEPTPDLTDALAAAGEVVTALLDAVEGLAVAVERVQAARLAAAARATDAIRRDAQTLLAVLGEHPVTEGTPS